jgi:tRNA(fMet)-specific endonuclease VapC
LSATHLLDTGWIVRHLRGDAPYTRTLTLIGASQLAVSIISVAELYEGVHRARDPARAEQSLLLFLADKTILPVTEDVCRHFGEHRARLRQAKQLIGDLDLLIGATCLHHILTLLTTNARHFQRLPGLTITSTPLP